MRNHVISQVRILAMLMIVFEHCFCYYGVWNYNAPYIDMYVKLSSIFVQISLPVFVFISGYLYASKVFKCPTQKTTNKQFIINKIKRLIIPYLFWGVIILLTLPNIYSPIRIFYGVSHLWFLLMLFNLFTIILFTKKIWLRTNLKKDLYILYFSNISISPYLLFKPNHCETQYIP